MSKKQTKNQIANLITGCSIKFISVKRFFDLMKIQQNHYSDFSYAGNGAFAFVLKATNNQIQKTVALKVVECENDDLVGMESVLREYELLEKFASKYIVKVYNCFFLTEDDDDESDDSNEDNDDQIAENKMKKQKKQRKVFFIIELEFCESKCFRIFHFC